MPILVSLGYKLWALGETFEGAATEVRSGFSSPSVGLLGLSLLKTQIQVEINKYAIAIMLRFTFI